MPCPYRAHAVPMPCHAVPMPCPCRSPAMPCREGFRMCLSHLIYTVRPCLIHTCHAMPMPCSDHAVLLKATTQHSRRETACGLPFCVRLLPATTRSSTKIISNIPISDAGGQYSNGVFCSMRRDGANPSSSCLLG